MRKVKPKSTDEEYGPLRTKGANEKIYPKIRIHTDHLPEAKDWKVGESHELHLRGKMVGLSQSKFQNEAEFEVTHLEPHDKDDEEEDGRDSDKDDEKKEDDEDDEKSEEGEQKDEK
jgi:hypothetical protein